MSSIISESTLFDCFHQAAKRLNISQFRPYQIHAINFALNCFLQHKHGALFSHEMSLGKTVMALGTAEMLRLVTQQRGDSMDSLTSVSSFRVLVVCNLSTLNEVWLKWCDQLKMNQMDQSSDSSSSNSHSNSIPNHNNTNTFNVHVFHGPDRFSSYNLHKLNAANVIITTYEHVHQEYRSMISENQAHNSNITNDHPNGDRTQGLNKQIVTTVKSSLLQLQFNLVIMDEIHKIKSGPKSHNVSAAICWLTSSRSQYQLGLTGTPIGNNRQELGAIARALRIPLPTATFWKSASDVEFKSLVETFAIRETRDSVGPQVPQLLNKKEFTVFCRLTPKQCRLTFGLMKRARELWSARNNESSWGMTMLKLIMSMRQIAHGPYLFQFFKQNNPQKNNKNKNNTNNKNSWSVSNSFNSFNAEQILTQSNKAAALCFLIQETLLAGESMVVFVEWHQGTETLIRLVKSKFPSLRPLRYDSSLKNVEREESLALFRRGLAQHSVFFCGMKAGAEGINLTRASRVVIFDPWFNPAVDKQALGRFLRDDQTKAVQVYRFVAAGRSADQAIRTTQLHKAKNEMALTCPEMTGSEYHLHEKQWTSFYDICQCMLGENKTEYKQEESVDTQPVPTLKQKEPDEAEMSEFLSDYEQSCRSQLAEGERFVVVETTESSEPNLQQLHSSSSSSPASDDCRKRKKECIDLSEEDHLSETDSNDDVDVDIHVTTRHCDNSSNNSKRIKSDQEMTQNNESSIQSGYIQSSPSSLTSIVV